MRAAVLVAIGAALVGFEFRTDAVDLLADPLGWLLVAAGARVLALDRVMWLCILAAPLSAPSVYLPFEHVLVDPETNDAVASCPFDVTCYEQLRYDSVPALRATAMGLSVVIGGVALVLLLRALRTRAGERTHQLKLRRQMQVVEVVIPVVWILPVLLAVGAVVITGDGYDAVWDGGLALLGGVRSLVMVWLGALFLVFADAVPRFGEHLRGTRLDR